MPYYLRSSKMKPEGEESVSHVQTFITRSNVNEFAGLIDENFTVPLESWIDSIDALLITKGILDPILQLNEAKSFLDYSKGDIAEWSRSIGFKKCKSWDDLKSFLRNIYSKDVGKSIVKELSEVMRLTERSGRSFISNNARIGDKLEIIKEKLKASQWAINGTQNMTIDNACILIQFGIALASLPEPLVVFFDKPLTPTSDESEIMSQISKHKGKLSHFDTSILTGKTSIISRPVSPVATISYVKNPSSNVQVRCKNCDRMGHEDEDCRTNYCSIHNTTSHAFKDCRVRNNRNNSPRQSRSVSRSRSYKKHYSNRNRSNTPYRQRYISFTKN